MKLAFIVPGFSADENDWCIPAHTDIVRALAQTHEVHVFALRYPHRRDTYCIGNATVHSFGGATVHGIQTAQLWQQVQREIAREHSRKLFDVIHAIFGSEAGCLTVLVGKRLRVPSVVWLVNGELVGLRSIGYGADLNLRLGWMNRVILNFAEAVLCGCDALKETAQARMSPERQRRAETLPLGVNTERFSGTKGTEEFEGTRTSGVDKSAHFINVGSLLPVKDQATLLRAFAHILQTMPYAHLTIAGIGPLQDELRTLTNELKIETNVTFAANVPHDRLPTLYHSADVFVQTSRHEGQGLALLEAAACGCAVCGTNVGALRDLARENLALQVAVGDADALADAMRYTFFEHVPRGIQAMEYVRREYNLGQICQRLNARYAALAG